VGTEKRELLVHNSFAYVPVSRAQHEDTNDQSTLPVVAVVGRMYLMLVVMSGRAAWGGAVWFPCQIHCSASGAYQPIVFKKRCRVPCTYSVKHGSGESSAYFG